MKRATYSEVADKIAHQNIFSSGDCAFTDVLWDKMRILPTDPGAHLPIRPCEHDAPACMVPLGPGPGSSMLRERSMRSLSGSNPFPSSLICTFRRCSPAFLAAPEWLPWP